MNYLASKGVVEFVGKGERQSLIESPGELDTLIRLASCREQVSHETPSELSQSKALWVCWGRAERAA